MWTTPSVVDLGFVSGDPFARWQHKAGRAASRFCALFVDDA